MRRIEVLEICFGYVDGFCMSIRVGYYCICGLSYCYTLRFVWMKGFGLEDFFLFFIIKYISNYGLRRSKPSSPNSSKSNS